jgi:hypothetical protein
MIWFALLLALFPALAGWRLRQRGWSWSEAGRIVALFGVGCFAASPFITLRSLGSGEAFNYSLAVADTITQMRAGVFPVFAGQSEYAFNSRVHPLRTAVYYTHSSGVLDILTCRQLTYWQTQNLSLSLSIMAAIFAAYCCLRRIPDLPAGTACLLAGWYGLCPGLLAPAYGMELYMTVTAAPFLPLAALGAAISVESPRFRWYALMAIGLAGAWLTHPPVAAWMSLACIMVAGMGLISRRPSLASLGSLTAATVLGLLLCGWALVSALTISPDNLVVTNIEANRSGMARAIWDVTSQVTWAALLPVRKGGGTLGDFQLGYAGWGLLLVSLYGMIRYRQLAPAAMIVAIAFCLVLTFPVPWVHVTLWSLLPTGFSSLTNIWPMQRAYLVISALVLVLFGLCQAARARHLPAHTSQRRRSYWASVIVCGLCGWTLWQSWQFIDRGLHDRSPSMDETLRRHLPSNRTLLQAYYLLPLPDSYQFGPRDPQHELRFLSFAGAPTVLIDNSAPSPNPRIEASGTWRVTSRDRTGRLLLSPALVLAPGKRYRLHVEFLTPKLDGLLILSGAKLYRELTLANTASKRGFGMLPGQSNSISLWSDLAAEERVEAILIPSDPTQLTTHEFARFCLEEVDPEQLALRLLNLVPTMKCSVNAPAAGWLETPRSHISGYVAAVDGQTVFPRAGPDGLMLVPVPAGRHTVELIYRAPLLLRLAAWISIVTWLGVLTLVAIRTLSPAVAAGLDRWCRNPRQHLWAATASALLTISLLGGILWNWQRANEQPLPGPLHLRVLLPLNNLGHNEPLVATGRGLGSTVVFLRHIDNETIQFGVDTWGLPLATSTPLKLDFSQPMDIKITTGGFYAGRQRDLTAYSADQQEWLLGHTLIWLNGQIVFEASEIPFDPGRTRRWTVGRQNNGGNSHRWRFGGLLTEHRWLPVTAAECPLPSPESLRREAGPLRVRALLPEGKTGQAEPLASFGHAQTGTTVFVHYLDATHVRFGMQGTEGPTVFTAPLSVDYRQPVDIELSHPLLYPPAHPALKSYSPRQAASLREKLRLRINGRPVLNEPLPTAGNLSAELVRLGFNAGAAHYPGPRFTGRILATRRVDQASWPLPPGDPEAATRSGSAGPLELTVQLPITRTGQRDTLLTTGQTGAGAIVMVHYLDDTHIRLGVDVWGKALFWSDPLPVDYAAPQLITVSASGLYPTGDPAYADLREELRVLHQGRTVIREKIFAHDSTPAEISLGRSLIGGSHADPVFNGEILAARRVSPTDVQK